MPAPSMEAQCDALIRQLGGAVVQFGQKNRRTRNTQGIPDRLYFVQNRMVYFEVKSASDYLSAKQILFLTNVLTHGGVAGCGSCEDLTVLLNAPAPLKVGHEQIGRYSSWSEHYKRRQSA